MTPKALLSYLKTLDSGYKSKLKGPQVDYFGGEQPGTTTAENGDAPLASPQPLHLDHHSSLPSLVETVTLGPKQDTFAELALLVPRAATDSSPVLSNPKLVADDSIWDGGQDHVDLETVTSDKSKESEESFMCRTSGAFERRTIARIIMKGHLNGGDSPVNRRMSM